MRKLTRAERWETCIHEAGHAIAFALGGVPVHRLIVAPEGAEGWHTQGRMRQSCADLWGLCEKAELVLPRYFLRWLSSEGGLHAHGRGFEPVLASPGGRIMVEGFSAEQCRVIRAQLLGLLAGPAAEQILRGEPVSLLDRPDLDDVAKAESLAWLLPERTELAHAAALIAATLREAAVWAQLVALARALEEAGEMTTTLRAHLPAARLEWPPAPPALDWFSAAGAAGPGGQN